LGTVITTQVNATTILTARVAVRGVTKARLHATVRTRIEQVTATTASATALSITFTLTGTAARVPVNVDPGTLTAGSATCNLPPAVAPTASGLTPPQDRWVRVPVIFSAYGNRPPPPLSRLYVEGSLPEEADRRVIPQGTRSADSS